MTGFKRGLAGPRLPREVEPLALQINLELRGPKPMPAVSQRRQRRSTKTASKT